jgi:hypothetical protein
MEEDLIKQLNDALALSLNIEPLTEFQETTNTNTARMNYGLAQAYANEGYREYLKEEINRAIKNTAVRSETLVDIAFGKARALTLKELLIKSKQAFEELQKIQELAKKKNAKS